MAVALIAPAASTAATSGSGAYVTFAARVCPDYADITANKARNDIQESLRDLGPDTPYSGGDTVDAATEERVQPTCKPLPNWSFTLGRSYVTRAVSGPWGSLSIVTNPFSTSIETATSVPLLDSLGRPTGDQLGGAVTIELTNEQQRLAARSSSLWVQGGTPADPVLDQRYPGEYGFGALRCATDDVNGDNVEYIAFPAGARHVFCFAYYVKPPPTSGTIVVRKEVDAPAGTAETSFRFTGNISFTESRSFTLEAAPGRPASTTFYRAEVPPGGEPWSFAEDVPDGWTLTGLTCTSQTGASVSTTDLASAQASVRLGAGDTVTCTYTDRLTPPAAGLSLSKITEGGIGRFAWTVTDPSGTEAPQTASATTVRPGVEQTATPAELSFPAGTYAIAEDQPESDRGRWSLAAVTCDGQTVDETDPVPVTLLPGSGTHCTFTNRFTPNGVIRIHKRTYGRGGTAGFVISPQVVREPYQLRQSATTRESGDIALARGDDTSALPLGRYVIQETEPRTTAGSWTLEAVVCNGRPVPSEQGAVSIDLTPRHPRVDCTFTNRHASEPTPDPDPPGPGPNPTPDPPAPDPAPVSDLRTTKTASVGTVAVGAPFSYRIVLRNAGEVVAADATVADVLDPRLRLRSIRTSRGTCRLQQRLLVCSFGDLAPGSEATVVATVSATEAGALPNRVAVNTGSQGDGGDKSDRAGVTVRRGPSFTG